MQLGAGAFRVISVGGGRREDDISSLTFFRGSRESKGRISLLPHVFPLSRFLPLSFSFPHHQKGEGSGAGDVAGAAGQKRSSSSRPFSRFFRRNNNNNNGGRSGSGSEKLSKGEATALLRQAQHEAAYLRSLVQDQSLRLQAAEEEAAAAAAAAAAATERERERRANCDGGLGAAAALDRQRQQQLLVQQQRRLKLNYLEVRHELLIDLWTLRVLDNEALGQHFWAGAGGGPG